MTRFGIAVAALLALLCAPSAAETQADRPLVTLFIVDNGGADPWRTGLTDIGAATAPHLGLRFEVVVMPRGRKAGLDAIAARLETTPSPDYALIINDRGLAVSMMTQFETRGIESVLFNSPLSAEEYAEFGGPGDTFKGWLAEIIPDDEQAGYDLARALIAEARARRPEGTLNLLAIGGSPLNTVSVARLEGLNRALAEAEDVVLLQSVSARWLRETAAEKYRGLAGRYDRVDIVWAASDDMALGVLGVAKALGHDVTLGGMNWSAEARAAMAGDSYHASMGGHAIDIALALGLIARHHAGQPLEDLDGDLRYTSRLDTMTSANRRHLAAMEALAHDPGNRRVADAVAHRLSRRDDVALSLRGLLEGGADAD